MIVVADSGATKTDWRIIKENGDCLSFETIGLSPYFNTSDDFRKALSENFPAQVSVDNVSHVYFYGSGCGNQERGSDVNGYLSAFFSNASVSAKSDALGAARALFGNSEGIVMILGTGSNVTYYNGKNLISKSPSLGFVLGDEGSGSFMGRLLLRAYLYGYLNKPLSKMLESEYNMDLSYILLNVYSKPRPSTYLASFVPFILKNIEQVQIREIVDETFSQLYQHHLRRYDNLDKRQIGVIGSVGCLFSSRLDAIAKKHGFKVEKYLRYPIEELLKYHQSFNEE